jgi:hypothetical protein
LRLPHNDSLVKFASARKTQKRRLVPNLAFPERENEYARYLTFREVPQVRLADATAAAIWGRSFEEWG